MSEIAVVKFLFRKDWSPLEEVIDKYSKEFGDIYDVGDDRDIIQVVSTSPATLVFACISDKDDLTKVLGFLKLQRRYVKDGNVKFSVINFLNNKQVEMALLKLGCQEVIDPGLKAKALKFKMDFWKKSLSVGTNKILEGAQVQSLKDKVAADKKAAAAEEKKAAQVKPITWTDALKVVDDMWLTKTPNDVKKILNRWMVKLMGPSPFVAQWMEVQGERNVWEFVFKDGIRENFHMADGSWFFSGDQKPEFMWKENVWLITGQKFQLFYQEETKVDYRLRATAQAVEVTKNSNYAISREQAIIDSFDQEVLMKKGLIDDTKTELEGETDAPADGLLSEEVDGAENVQKHYKGKLSHQKDEQAEERQDVDGRAERIQKNYDGKSSSDDLGASHYNGKLEHGDEPTDVRRKARGRADELEEGSGNAGTDDVGPNKYKGKLEYSESDRKSHYGGKSETDDLGDSHYSNQPGGAGASLKKKRSADEDEEVDDFGEDAETDHLGHRKAHPLDAKRRSHEKGEVETDERRSRDPKSFERALDKRARAISDILPDGNAGEDADQTHDASDKLSELRREKKMRSIADLLPDGNAEDPQEEIRPRGDAGLRTPEEASRAKMKPHLVKSPAEQAEADRSSAVAKAKAAVPSLSDEAPVGDDGKPVVASEATVVVILRKKSEPSIERIIQLDDFFEDTAIIHMHGNPLVAGDAIELTMTFDYMERTKRIQVSGVCLEADANEDGEAFCTIKIEATSLKIFEQFMLLYQLRQQHIHSFLKAAKGY